MMTELKRWTNPRLALSIGAASLVAAISVYGCAPAGEMDESSQTTGAGEPEPAGVVIPEVPVPPAVTINHVMVAQIDHASHELWDAARQERVPETDQDWRELQHHAIQIATGGTSIALGGSGQADAGYVQLVGWSQYAQDMTDAAVSAFWATENQDLDALLTAGDALVESCEGCHREFKPDLPSEGYEHPHYLGPTPLN